MGIARNSQTVITSLSSLAAVVAAVLVTASASAAGAPEATPSPTAEPTPEPTEIPRPDVLNIKKNRPQDALLASEWSRLTLLKKDDLPGWQSEISSIEPKLQQRIIDTFGLPAVMTMREPLLEPPGWWTVAGQGKQALTLGPTRHWTRPEFKVEVPILRLKEVPYLKGDSEFVRAMNEIVRQWTLGRISLALKLRDKLQTDKKTIPRGTLERTAVAVLSGFLDLHAASEMKMPLGRSGPAQGSFWDALGKTETSIYLTNVDNAVDERFFKTALTQPAVFSEDGVYPPELSAPLLADRPMDMIQFVRTLALPALFNASTLSVKVNNWMRVYEIAQKFDEIFDKLDRNFTARKSTELSFTTPPGVKVSHPVMMWPRTAAQMKTVIQMLKVQGQFVAQDPLLALRESAKVILGSDSPEFRTIGFAQVARVYDELGYPNYARRFFAFAESFADSAWYQQNPIFLLSGAENAFWTGDTSVAKKAFEKFLLAAGDPLYGPWARLRLAEIVHLTEGSDVAALRYAELVRLNAKHPVAQIARRRLFCSAQNEAGARARYLEYQSLKESFGRMEAAEVEQIRACHLIRLVDDASRVAGNTAKTLPEDAAFQLELISEFEKKFPSSSYLKFLEERKTVLQTALGPYYLSYKQCDKALEFFRKNEEKLNSLKKNSGRFLSVLKWTDEEQDRLKRCAALFASKDVLKKIQPELLRLKAGKKPGQAKKKALAESTEKAIIRLAMEMSTEPADQKAAELFSALRRDGQDDLWSLVRSLEEKQSQSIDDEKFWKQLAAVRVMQWDLEQSEGKKRSLRRVMRAEVMRLPERTLERVELCDRFLLESSTLSPREWDVFVTAVPTDRWLDLARMAEAQPSCKKRVFLESLGITQSSPSLKRDRHLLLPWLKTQGAQKEQEAWLALASRWANEPSVSKQEVGELFKTLEKEADIPAVKEAARAWREKNSPSGLW